MAESRVPVSIYSKFFCIIIIIDLTAIISDLSILRIAIVKLILPCFLFLVTMVNITLDMVGVLNLRPS